MKRLLLPSLLAVSVAFGAHAEGRGTTVTCYEGTYTVDTVFHAKVGPGTTQTALRLTGPRAMDVFYVTVDQSTPGVSIRTLSGGDKVAGNARTSAMAQKHTREGLHYFAGSNGDFYFTGGTASNGSSIVGTPTNAFVVDRETFRSSASSYQFSVDTAGVARVCRLSFASGTVSLGEQTAPLKAVNNDAPNNAVTVYTSKFWGSANQGALADNCSEVTARLVEGEAFHAGCKCRMEITSTPTRTGDLAIPDEGFVLLGRGSAEGFVAALKPGDIVTLDNVVLTPEGQPIVPSCVVSGNPKNVGGGINLDSEAERGDAAAFHPRTGIGVSADGTKIVMMVVDGRSGRSAGCTTGTLGDLLIFAGCHEGVNLDGGGSSTLYTEALGVRNACSDGNERQVSNAVYAVLEAPEDSVVAELAFYDYNPTLPFYGMFTPRLIAFNKHGLALDTDFKDFTLSCPAELGEIINDGHTLYITGRGCHALTARFGDAEVSIPVYVGDATEASLHSESVVIDSRHPYSIGLYSSVAGRRIDLNPAALQWSSGDASVATVDAAGLISAVANGKTTVTGTSSEGISLTQYVSVENADAVETPFITFADAASWRTAKSDIVDVTYTPGTAGFGVDFTVKLTRNPKFTLNVPDITTFGLPEAIDLVLRPGATKFSKIALSVVAANRAQAEAIELSEIPEGELVTARFNLADYFDTADLTTFPITVRNIAFSFGNAQGEACHFDVEAVNHNYDVANGIEAVAAPSSLRVRVIGSTAFLASPARSIAVTDLQGRVLATGSGSSITLPAADGVYILTADALTAKIVR